MKSSACFDTKNLRRTAEAAEQTSDDIALLGLIGCGVKKQLLPYRKNCVAHLCRVFLAVLELLRVCAESSAWK
jgi:hypothetical protein